ncbi:MAG: hypothetical protein KDK41_00110 [Leptospiraceae bacterium]|nr:hypothetical protein [Leptospiraceae bacterium]
MFTRLAAKQVIGLNRREIDFISPENSRYLIQKVAHNKLYSKKILADAGLPVP